MKRLLFGLALWSAALHVYGQDTNPPAVVAEQRYQLGLTKQTEAELATQKDDARKLYREAIAEYQALSRAKPDHYQSQVYWGISLTQLATLAPEQEERNDSLIAANQRFAAAADCPGADDVVFEQWAVLLGNYIYNLVPTEAQRVTVSKEIVDVCTRGLKLAREAGPRAQLERHLGDALERQANLATDPTERDALRQQAERHRRAATQAIAAQQRYQAGVAKQAAAEMAATPADARRLYLEALAAYQAAIQTQPDQALSQLLAATCLTQLIPLAADADERGRFIRDADQRFASASQCPAPPASAFEQWASLLMGTVYATLPDRDQRRALLTHTIDVCQRGLAVAGEPTPRAQLQRHLGSALMWSVEFSTNRTEQLSLLERALEHLRLANQSVTVRLTLYQNSYLGIALLSLGRLRNDPALLREAATEFAAALQAFPNQYDIHYSLAATWSLLGDADRAAQHLAAAIDHDADGSFHRRAQADPDLAAVRGSPAYTAALDRRRRLAAETQATAFYRQALQAQQQAAHTNDLLLAHALLQQADALCQQAIALTPDHYLSQALDAAVLVQLARQNPAPADQDQLPRYRQAARTRFAAAALCPEAEPALYDQWADFLLRDCWPHLATGPEQRALLTHARDVLGGGLTRARFTGLRSHLEAQLGSCLVLLAQAGNDAASQLTGATSAPLQRPESEPWRAPLVGAELPPHASPIASSPAALYAEATKYFQAAEAGDPKTLTAEGCQLWGVALLRHGQATRDKMMIRQAIDRLLRALELQPEYPAAQFSLAAAYAQLRQFDQATRHLQQCLRHDPRGLFHARAEADPDLRALRQTDAVRRLLHLPTVQEPATRTTISEK